MSKHVVPMSIFVVPMTTHTSYCIYTKMNVGSLQLKHETTAVMFDILYVAFVKN